ncbi:hypothetical protein DOY81_008517, partial [Sarcophaga bullata]
RKMPKKLQTQQGQFEILVAFMVQHSDLAKGLLQCGNAKQRANNLRVKLVDDLNSNRPPVRDIAGWKKMEEAVNGLAIGTCFGTSSAIRDDSANKEPAEVSRFVSTK